MNWLVDAILLVPTVFIFFIISSQYAIMLKKREKHKVDYIAPVSVLIPAHNEEKYIEETINAVLNSDHPAEKEIIVINDGSTDRTAEIAGGYPEVRLINHDRNLGYGASLKTGIRNSCSDIVLITDADNTYPNEKIDEIITLLKEENLDMVVGSRTSSHVEIIPRGNYAFVNPSLSTCIVMY